MARAIRRGCRAIKSADRKELQGFINSTLALPFQQTLIAQTAKSVLAARVDLPPQLVPADAIALTAGVALEAVSRFADRRLGKGVVITKDTGVISPWKIMRMSWIMAE